jgi:SdrD B-like domain
MFLSSRILLFSLLAITLVSLSGLISFSEPALANQDKPEEYVWRVKLAPNTQANSYLEVRNQCRGTHIFDVSFQGPPYLRIFGYQPTTVAGHSSQNLPALFDSTGLNPGEYPGTVSVFCRTCGAERGCSQDRYTIPVRLTVTAPTPTPANTPTPTPGNTPAPSPVNANSPTSPAGSQGWSVALEENPGLTNCGTTKDIPVDGASDCTTATAAAWKLLTTLFQTPDCMSSGCPAGATITQGVSTCRPDPYVRPNGSPAMRWQVSWTWKCVQDSKDSSDSCNNDSCKVNTVILNTGLDQVAGAPYAPVQPDGYWELVDAPNVGLTIPTPAWVIAANPAWITLANSNWISAYNVSTFNKNNPSPDKPYSFQRCFCTCPGVESIDLDLQLLVDNVAEVYFDNASIGSQPNTSSGSFRNPLHISKRIPVEAGKHCLRVDVRNLSGVAMGVNVAGTAKSAVPAGAPLFLSASCCNATGKILGKKIDDTDCNGKDDGEPGLSGWTITATNTASGATVTATTDANGFYYFNNLPPGTYKISEGPQTGWTQSIPGGGGTYTVTLDANQVVQKDFGNCKKSEQACAHVTDKEILCQTQGGFSYTFDITNNSGNDVQQILITPPSGSTLTLSPQVFNLSTPLQNGQSTTITVNLGNVKPGDKSCFFVTLMSKDGACCTIEVCPVLPGGCATVTNVDVDCHPDGSYTYVASITNNTASTIQNIYFHPQSGAMTPNYLAVNLAPGATFQTPPIKITGAKPGEFCFDISLHTADMKTCSTTHVCIDLKCDDQAGTKTFTLPDLIGITKDELYSRRIAFRR